MEIKQTPIRYGYTQELEVLSILGQYGTVSIPFGNSARYDCILDLDDKNIFYRIQIKSLNILEDGRTIIIPMRNQNCKKGINKTYTKEEVDYIAIAYNHQCFLFSPEMAKGQINVSITEPKYYNQHYLYDYELTKVLDVDFISWVDIKREQREQKQQQEQQTQKQAHTCSNCGKSLKSKPKTGLCSECYKKSIMIGRPSKEELASKLGIVSFIQMGKEYGVSDNAVRKWCKAYELPYRVADIKAWRENKL